MTKSNLAVLAAFSAIVALCHGTSAQSQDGSDGGAPHLERYCPALRSFYPEVIQCPGAWVLAQRPVDPAELAARQATEAVRKQQEAQAQQAAENLRKANLAEEQEKARFAQESAGYAAQGYEKVGIDDIILDFKTMSGSEKFIVSGYMLSLGEMTIFTNSEMGGQQIDLDVGSLSRATRKILLQCEAQTTFCVATIWAKPTCNTKVFGVATDQPCLTVEAVQGGVYSAGNTNPIMR